MVLLIQDMVKSQTAFTCLKELEDLAGMTEQQRKNLEILWLRLEDVQAAIQSNRSAKEVRKQNHDMTLN